MCKNSRKTDSFPQFAHKVKNYKNISKYCHKRIFFDLYCSRTIYNIVYAFELNSTCGLWPQKWIYLLWSTPFPDGRRLHNASVSGSFWMRTNHTMWWKIALEVYCAKISTATVVVGDRTLLNGETFRMKVKWLYDTHK